MKKNFSSSNKNFNNSYQLQRRATEYYKVESTIVVHVSRYPILTNNSHNLRFSSRSPDPALLDHNINPGFTILIYNFAFMKEMWIFACGHIKYAFIKA